MITEFKLFENADYVDNVYYFIPYGKKYTEGENMLISAAIDKLNIDPKIKRQIIEFLRGWDFINFFICFCSDGSFQNGWNLKLNSGEKEKYQNETFIKSASPWSKLKYGGEIKLADYEIDAIKYNL